MGTRARVDSFPARLDRSAISSTLGSNSLSTRPRVDEWSPPLLHLARLDRSPLSDNKKERARESSLFCFVFGLVAYISLGWIFEPVELVKVNHSCFD